MVRGCATGDLGCASEREHGGLFKRTAHAVYQNLHLFERERTDPVAVFAADH